MKKTSTFKILSVMTTLAIIFALPSVAFGDQIDGQSDELTLSTELSRAEKELLNGKKVTVQGKKGSVKYYYVSVPTGARDLVIKMSGGTGDADLCTKFGSKPDVNHNPDPNPGSYDDSRAKWDCRPYKDGNADLFRKYEQSPTLSDNDRYSINPDNSESMTVSNSGGYGSSYPIKAGTYYIGIYGDENFSDAALTVSYE